MTRKRATIVCPREPIGLSLDESAAYVGMSPALFERLIREGVMPCPRQFKKRLIWDADELLAAFRRTPHKALDLSPGVAPMHDDDAGSDDPYDKAPRA